MLTDQEGMEGGKKEGQKGEREQRIREEMIRPRFFLMGTLPLLDEHSRTQDSGFEATEFSEGTI
jgi:hypothetical protein